MDIGGEHYASDVGGSGPSINTDAGSSFNRVTGPSDARASCPSPNSASVPSPNSASGPPINRAVSSPRKRTANLPFKSQPGPSIDKETGPSIKTVDAFSHSSTSGPSTDRAFDLSRNRTVDISFRSKAGPSIDREAGPSTNNASGPLIDREAGPSTNNASGPLIYQEAGPSTNNASGPLIDREAGPSNNSLAYLSTNSAPSPSNNRTIDFPINNKGESSIEREAGPSTGYVITHTRNPSHDIPMCWRVENALTFTKDVLTSPILKSQECRTKINVLLRFKESKSGKFTVVSVGFQRNNKPHVSLLLTYDLSLENSEGDVYVRKKSEIKFEKHMDHDYCISTKFTKNSFRSNDFQADSLDDSILKDLGAKGLAILEEGQQVLYLLPDDVLFVKGHVTVIGCCTMTRTGLEMREQTPLQRCSNAHVALQRDFRKAFEKCMFHDVDLLVDDQIFSAHKFVLAARSPKLKMTLEEFTDKETHTTKSSFRINGVSKSIFEILLHFLYTGNLATIDELDIKLNLYKTAHHFEIDSLKEECARMMLQDISQDNAFKLLEFADSHKDVILKNGIIGFIVENFEEMNEAEEWDMFLNSNTVLAAEVLKQYSPKKRRK